MKFSSKVLKCGLSPMRKFHPYAVAAEAKGRKIYHLNIGQPDIETPRAFFDAARDFGETVLAYAPAPGVEVYLEAVRDYYARLGYPITCDEILATYGGSEALQMALTCILDEGDEILIPEPFYPNYNTFVSVTGGVVRPIPTTPEEGYRYATREQIEPLINEHTRAILVTNPGNPTGVVLDQKEMRMIADIAKERDLFLICDEVLSVGDFRFQEKCHKRIGEMLEKGTTLLFVSHSIEQVEGLCNKAVWLEHGNVKMFGDCKKVAEIYRTAY